MKDIYYYPAVIKDKDKRVVISFIDFEKEISSFNIDDACMTARYALCEMIHKDYLVKSKSVPESTSLNCIEHKDKVIIVEANMPLYYYQVSNSSVATYSVTLPKKLRELAKSLNINLSHVLVERLKHLTGIDKKR